MNLTRLFFLLILYHIVIPRRHRIKEDRPYHRKQRAQYPLPEKDDRDTVMDKAMFKERFNKLKRKRVNKKKSASCGYRTYVSWMTKVGGPIIQTPRVVDFYNDGVKEIVIPTYIRYVEVVNGIKGEESEGWPFAHPLYSSYSSSILYDIDKDGLMEIVISTFDGTVLFFSQIGEILKEKTIFVLPLEVQRDWYKGLDDETVDFEMKLHDESNKYNNDNDNDNKDNNIGPDSASPGGKKLLEDEKNGDSISPIMGTDGWFSDYAIRSMDLLNIEINPLNVKDDNNIFEKERYLLREWYKNVTEEWVLVDPHILSTPIIVDLDDNGVDEIIIPVSYYFDPEYYSFSDHLQELRRDIDITKYVAGGITVIDLENMSVKWSIHLDLTTLKASKKAFIYSSPTIVDFDANGSNDIITSNSLGYIYALNKDGKVHEGFPIIMEAGIQGQILAEDINGNGFIELCAVDMTNHFICYNFKGEELWRRKLNGDVDHSAVCGDINNDGHVNIIIGTSEGYIYAFDGKTDNGKPLDNFPFKIDGGIHTPVTLIDFTDNEILDIVVHSNDGHVYIINPQKKCFDKIDVGDKSFSRVLVDDITSNGFMDLLTTTVDGELYCIGTKVKYHPLKATSSHQYYINGFSYRYNHHGIYVTEKYRMQRDVIGGSFALEFEIVDNRELPEYFETSYHVKVSIGKKINLYDHVYSEPGKYRLSLGVPHSRMKGVIYVTMKNEHGQSFEDFYTISFNMGFLRVIKWLLVIPFVFTFLFVFFFNNLNDQIAFKFEEYDGDEFGDYNMKFNTSKFSKDVQKAGKIIKKLFSPIPAKKLKDDGILPE